jgi:hypothetical protein
MPKTYEPIATTTVGTATNTVSFSSISGSYTDLIAVVSAAASALSEIDIRMGNGSVDTGSNYSQTWLTGDGTSATSARDSNRNRMRLNYNSLISTTLGNDVHIFQFMNYANTTTNKTVLYRGNSAAYGTDASVGLWRGTSAINVITFYANVDGTKTFSTGSIFTLYGIKAA